MNATSKYFAKAITPRSPRRVLGVLSAYLCAAIVALWIASHVTEPMGLALDEQAVTVVSVHRGSLQLGRNQYRYIGHPSTLRFNHSEDFQINWRVPGVQFQVTEGHFLGPTARYQVACRMLLFVPASFFALCSVCLLRTRDNTFLNTVQLRRRLASIFAWLVGIGFLIAGGQMLAWCYTTWTTPANLQRNWSLLETMFNRGCISCVAVSR